jgi:ribosomal protein S18 acetylase RimI-like enzyme
MYKCEKLTKRKIYHFTELNNTCWGFNILNKDFFELYNKASFTERIFLRSQVKLLKFNNEYIGYLWMKKCSDGYYSINSFNIMNPDHHISGGHFLLRTLRNKCKFEYQCEKNDFNFSLLPQLGFKKEDGTVELIKVIDGEQFTDTGNHVSFESFARGAHEHIRCRLQNEIFKDSSRDPLNLEDIYFDVIQNYFWDKGSIFLKCDNHYIGYGQIILDGSIPTIVNFGILNEFRSRGYGKLLLTYLIDTLYNNGYREVRIKVNSNNFPAYRLYLKLGFVRKREYYSWILTL